MVVVPPLLYDAAPVTDPDIAILLSVANDYDSAGPQFATLAALMRRVAGKLHEQGIQVDRCASLDSSRVVDGDFFPGMSCPNCDE